MRFLRSTRNLTTLARPAAILMGGLAAAAFAEPAMAEPASCLSFNPADWPAPSKPYFMLAIDTSGSMTTAVGAGNSCSYLPNDRNAHARCAMKNTLLAFGGQVNFGLATFAVIQNNCGAACYGTCQYFCFPTEQSTRGSCTGCGPRPGNATTSAGAFIRVPMLQDSFWQQPPPPSNVAELLTWADNDCTGSAELFPQGNTPLNGMLRDMKRYFATGWTAPDNSVTYPSPLAAQDLAGAGVNGSTGCRSINVILQTDGDETCDTQADAVAAAQDLYTNGVTVGGKTYKIRTHVINFAGGSVANTDAIAAAGGTGASYFATNEVQLSTALANIIGGAIKPETCDNTDNNCNGCTDEGFKHYCDQGQTCCAWANAPARQTCLTNYKNSITPALPSGDLTKLPCTTPAQQADPLNWLCFNPKETCDNVDNNCDSGVDEGVLKCGNPLHCPVAEVCGDADDNDCDGLVDEGCPICVPSPEICDGCDNDCDGIADDGVAAIPCGLPAPANCTGTKSCKPPVAVPPGTCAMGGGFNNCTNNPQPETCDGADNDCDGVVDDGVPGIVCVPPGTPPGLNYGPNSQCKQGNLACGQATCVGFVGPSTEICDGIDNDCDGQVDEGVLGVGVPCGISQPPCMPGTTVCANGVLSCQGGVSGTPEKCDGIDNDCDGQVDDGQLSDGPPMGMTGCWQIPGNCCTFKNVQWCPPPGATCNDVGTLTPPCAHGTLVCAGAGGWLCQGSKGPSGEVCDGLDNNCNGMTDEGNLPQVGQTCGSDTGECVSGTTTCANGVIDCVGDVPPSQETCDGKDNDCDGVIDNGVVVGAPCVPAFDAAQYPNTPTDPALLTPPCQPGTLQCDGNGGTVCVGGKGPSPELCDGIDNDCDGQLDETGPAPNGIDGTANPFPPPAAGIGDVCGVNVGECKEGAYACVNGQFQCVGGKGAAPEECDCNDNDCDGSADNQTPNGPPICGAGKTCVQAGPGNCQCAKPCGGGEFDCPGGQKCQAVTDSQGNSLGNFCVSADPCGDCSTKSVPDGMGGVLCAPAGSPEQNCVAPPVCKCAGQNGCKDPCFGVVCSGGLVCSNYGATAGQCVPDSCFINPCPGCAKVCTDAGTCVDNPCMPGSCPADQECKPSADFSKSECVPSCANVSCPMGQTCKEGVCLPACDPACAADQVCDQTLTPPACVPNQCKPGMCPGLACCDPLTGMCGACPCEGVICPAGQVCSDGSCVGGGAGGAGGSSASSSSSGAGGNASTSSSSGAGVGGGRDTGVFGLPTGGGGLKCAASPGEVGSSSPNSIGGLIALALAALGVRRRRSTAKGSEVAR